MKTGWMIAVALLLAGCVSLRPPAGSDPQLTHAMAEALDAVQQVAMDMEAGGAADFAPAAQSLERAQIAATASAIGAPHPDLPGRAAVGVALGLCSEGLKRLERRLLADPSAAPGLAAAWRLGCVAPLQLIGAR